MADDRRRRHLGGSTSAALPVLWKILADRGWTPARLAADLEEDSGKVARLLYGDRKPGRALSVKLNALGVAFDLWEAPLPDGWLPAHAADESGEHPAVDPAQVRTG